MRADIRAEFEKIGFIYYSNLFDKRAENKANNLFNISSYNLLKADKYYSQYYLDEAQSLRSRILLITIKNQNRKFMNMRNHLDL